MTTQQVPHGWQLHLCVLVLLPALDTQVPLPVHLSVSERLYHNVQVYIMCHTLQSLPISSACKA